MWTLRVTGRRRRRRATVSRGRAWFGRNEQRQPWYSAAPNQEPVHRRLLRRLDREADPIAEQRTEVDPSPNHLHQRMRPELERLERSAASRLLGGVHLRVDTQRQRYSHGKANLQYEAKVGPNMADALITIPARPRNWRRRLTRAASHPALRLADPPISGTELGPYSLLPGDPWSTTPTNPEFRLEERGNPWARPDQSVARWNAGGPTASLVPEEYTWDGSPDQFRLRRTGVQGTMVTNRRNWFQDRVVGLRAARTTAAVSRAMFSHPQQATVHRPVGTIAAEEALGAPGILPHGYSHAESRHVFGAGTGIQDRRDLAFRASFKRVIEHGGLVQTPMGQDATAFLNAAAADAALRGAFASTIAPRWARSPRPVREHLAGTAGSYGAIARIPPTRVAVAARTAATAHPPTERPGHRPQWPPVGTTGVSAPYAVPNPGQRPLSNHPDDIADWQAWWTGGSGPGGPIPPTTPGSPHEPLTTYRERQVSRAQLVLRAASAAGTFGFVVYTFYPLP